jgi:conjugal transfer mating pair stabilization protein TraN
MNKFISLFIAIFLMSNAYSDDIQSIVNQTLAQSDSLKKDSYAHIKNFDPNAVFDKFTTNPAQTQYYGGVTQSDTTKLNQDAMNAPSSTDAGGTVSNSLNQHPKFVVSNEDPDIKHAELIQSDANNIVHGVTDRYVDCKSSETCNTTYQKQICEEAPQSIAQSCKNTLNIDIIPHETTTHYTLLVHLTTSDHSYSGINIDAVTGRITFIGPRDTSFRLDGRLPSNINCGGLQGSVTQFDAHNRGTRLDNISFPSCGGMALAFHLSGPKKNTINLDMKIDIASKVITYDVKDRWIDNCAGLLHEPSCNFKTKICDIPKETKVIQGIPVTRDCWQESFTYICHGGSGEGNCKALQSQGCEQIDSVCKESKVHECSLYQQTYQCPIQSCSTSANIVCGDGKNYCLDGNCVDHNYTPSKDFAKGISTLSATADASKQLDPSSITIFAGHSSECSEIPMGFSNCCTEKGWGQDGGLANCSLQEKKLHESREKKVVVKVGRYCSGSGPFPCIEHSQVFCVFNSKLARIIQQQGRMGQLGITFGSAKHPNCLGITPDQLQSIDLEKIDFQDFYVDIHAKQPDVNKITKIIQDHIQQFQNAGQTNG